ncbi:MAG TPA: hypothetical protein VGS22_20410 [Thermoanaerobaculia bacterium]|nr:hypothetical protein [Thermoanaerobaculia bacterium]
MTISTSKLTAQGQICGDLVQARYTSEDLHFALFDVPPQPHTLEEMKEGTRTYIKKRHACG